MFGCHLPIVFGCAVNLEGQLPSICENKIRNYFYLKSTFASQRAVSYHSIFNLDHIDCVLFSDLELETERGPENIRCPHTGEFRKRFIQLCYTQCFSSFYLLQMAKLSQPFINSYLVKRSFYGKAEIRIQGLKMDFSRSASKGME